LWRRLSKISCAFGQWICRISTTRPAENALSPVGDPPNRLAFRPGFQNPPEAAALEPAAELSLEEAVAYLRRQIERIRRGERMTQVSAVEGPYSHEQWVYIHLRHAELHLSFLGTEDDTWQGIVNVIDGLGPFTGDILREEGKGVP
jgi:hypothetical protein